MNQEVVTTKCLQLAGEWLTPPYRRTWTPDNPTAGYCYMVSEALYHYGPAGTKACCVNMGEEGIHWYLMNGDAIVDYTGNQFKRPVDYAKGVGKGFMKGTYRTKRGYISKRGYRMALHLGLISDDQTTTNDEMRNGQ